MRIDTYAQFLTSQSLPLGPYKQVALWLDSNDDVGAAHDGGALAPAAPAPEFLILLVVVASRPTGISRAQVQGAQEKLQILTD